MSTNSTYIDTTDKPTFTLESVECDFLNWRRDPDKGTHIPEILWDSVVALLSHHRKSHVLRRLGISHSQLVRKLKNRQTKDQPVQSAIEKKLINSPKSISRHGTFIKAIVAPPLPITRGFDVVLTKPNGAILQIQKLSSADLLKLTEQFTG